VTADVPDRTKNICDGRSSSAPPLALLATRAINGLLLALAMLTTSWVARRLGFTR
jgi:hypothetical protein